MGVVLKVIIPATLAVMMICSLTVGMTIIRSKLRECRSVIIRAKFFYMLQITELNNRPEIKDTIVFLLSVTAIQWVRLLSFPPCIQKI